MDHDARKPLTIKSVPARTSQRIAAGAAKRGQSQADWLTVAVDNQTALEAGDQVTMPERPEPRREQLPGASPAELAALAQAVYASLEAARLAATACGIDVPKVIGRHAMRLLSGGLRQINPPRPRKPALIDGLPRSAPGLPAV